MQHINRTILAPVRGYAIGQRFGENPDWYKRFGLAGHAGLDYPCPQGTEVIAVADGIVKAVEVNPGGFGLYVCVDHGCFDAYYAHLHAARVVPMQEVQAGYVIAESGGARGDPYAGNSTGAHLHFEMRPAYGGLREYGGACDPEDHIVTGSQGERLARVIAYALSVRAGPGTKYRIMRYLKKNDTVTVWRVCEGWAQIGGDEWVKEGWLVYE